MAHKVQVNAGVKSIVLPDGNPYDGVVEVTLTDAQYDRLRPALFTNNILDDLGPVADPDVDATFATDASVAAETASRSAADVALAAVDATDAGWFKIASQTLLSAQPSMDFTTIPQGYKHLKIVASLRGTNASGTVICTLSVNNDTTDANYFRTQFNSVTTTVSTTEGLGASNPRAIAVIPAASAAANHWASLRAEIGEYASPTKIKHIDAKSIETQGITTGLITNRRTAMFRNNVAAIDRITLAVVAGNFAIGSTVDIYGVMPGF